VKRVRVYPQTGGLRIRRGIWQGVCLGVLAASLAAGFNAVRSSGLPWVGQWSPATAAAANLQGVMAITIQEAWSRYQEGKALFVDARDPLSFKGGHIKGSWYCPAGEEGRLLEEIRILAKAGLAVIVYCDGVDCPLSPELARTLQRRGVPSVKIIVDGWRLWSEAGYPVEGGGR
jgi:3-mercaptopyruvate sulfurtransferase SseA